LQHHYFFSRPYLIQNNKELKEAETDKFKGFYFTQEDLEKEVENW
jgi:hypothetical protein